MALTEQQIRQITDEIVRSLTKSMKEEAPAAPPQTDGCTGRWLCDTAEEAVANAKAAQAQLSEMTLEKRGELIAAMRKAGIDNAEYLARLAHEETGYGRVADKVQKNLLDFALYVTMFPHPRHRGSGDPMRDGRQGHDAHRAGALRRDWLHHPFDQPHVHRHQ